MIEINPYYLYDAIRSFHSDMVEVYLGGAKGPKILRDGGVIALIVPRLISKEE